MNNICNFFNTENALFQLKKNRKICKKNVADRAATNAETDLSDRDKLMSTGGRGHRRPDGFPGEGGACLSLDLDEEGHNPPKKPNSTAGRLEGMLDKKSCKRPYFAVIEGKGWESSSNTDRPGQIGCNCW